MTGFLKGTENLAVKKPSQGLYAEPWRCIVQFWLVLGNVSIPKIIQNISVTWG